MTITLYNNRLKEGKCPKCGGKRDNYYIHCDNCRAIMKEAVKKYRRLNPERVAIALRKHRIKNRKEHRCMCCGRDLTGDHRVYCYICREKRNEQAKVYYLNKLVRQVRTSILM